MRKPTTDKPPQVEPRLDRRSVCGDTRQLISQVRQYELITPLFGGGVEPAVADPVTVVRGSEIRGHLRFWWRACRGGQFGGDLARMKESEDLLWGTTSTSEKPSPSQVGVNVEITNLGQEEQPFETKTRASQDWRDLAYAAFPLQETLAKVRTRVAFTLMLTFPRSYQAQVEGALWAWETFGGIGARTRRGFGALKGVRLDSSTVSLPHPGNVQQWITENLRAHVAVGTCPDGVPHIEQGWQGKITAGQRSPVEAWKFLIRKLKEFRQQRPGPPNDPGRSVWPEPDAVRRITRQHLNKVVNGQARRHEPVHSAGNIFPRAAFGMPIIFHFKDMNRSNPSDPNSDPKDTTLQGVNCHRFASPLILRPLACSEGRAVGLAVILQGSDLPPLILKGAPENPPVRATLTSTEASAISPLDGNPDVLQKFLQTF